MRLLYWILIEQVGIDPRKFLFFIIRSFTFFADFVRFKKINTSWPRLYIKPCMHDKFDTAGEYASEYFWQDLNVAQKIYSENPKKICDVGSRIDGFVAHIASFRPLTVLDIRPVDAKIPNVTFIQADLSNSEIMNRFDLVTCLHTLEHFGLGRYGDPIDPNAWKKGLFGLANLIETDGKLLLSTPVGRKAVYFNANYVFDPLELILEAEKLNLILLKAEVFDQDHFRDLSLLNEDIKEIALKDYSLVIFTFEKK